MEKLFRKIKGKNAPNPPKRDYSDKQGGERRAKSSMSDSEDEAIGGGVFRGSNETSPRGSSPTPHSGGNVERFRFGSQTSYGTGTVDLKSCGAGSGVQIGTNSRGNVASGGEGFLDTRRRNDSGGGPKSPNTKTPIVLEDYSDPKDVLKAAVDSGILPPRTEGPNPNRPYAEDDYSVPYEIIKQMRSGFLPDDGPIPNQPYADDDYSLPYDLVKKTKHHIPEEGWDPNRMAIPEDDYSLPYDVIKQIKKQPPHNSKRQHQHQYEEPPDVSDITRRTSAGDSSEEAQHWEETPNNTGQEKAGSAAPTRDPEENGTNNGPLLSPAPDQTPQNDMRPQGEYDNPWEWRSHRLPRLQPESPGDKEKQNIASRSGASTPDNSRRNSPRKPSKELKLELRHRHEVQGEKIDPHLSLDRQSFYHGKLSRTEAEKLLKPCKECSYLVRQSESTQKDYSLSLKSAKGFMHMKIVSNPQGYILGEFSKPFAGIPAMIHYYTTHKLNIRGAEHMALLHPVETQML